MAAFEEWAEMSHDEHLSTIAMVRQDPDRYIEIDSAAEEIEDDNKLQYMYAAARAKGVELDPNRNPEVFGGCPECHLLSGIVVEPAADGYRFWCVCHDHKTKWLWDVLSEGYYESEEDLPRLAAYKEVNPWPPPTRR
ncbi:MAG TPA: hypothetical protein VEG60_29915 [Candidatus Binatia bacterium]|nr:hypothetical protein [Candidatus Binatia bacterium]